MAMEIKSSQRIASEKQVGLVREAFRRNGLDTYLFDQFIQYTPEGQVLFVPRRDNEGSRQLADAIKFIFNTDLSALANAVNAN